MLRVDQTLELNTSYEIANLGDKDKLLFIDIETTGFSAKRSKLYMIGLMYYNDDKLCITQVFAEKESCEQELLSFLSDFCKNFEVLLHFNGNIFDLPYLKEKFRSYDMEHPFDMLEGIDLYKRISSFKQILHLENCKQKTIEDFLGIQRKDTYNGRELIEIYQRFLQNNTESDKDLLFLHNFDDMKGMFQLLPILTYSDLLLGYFRVVKVQANVYSDINNEERTEVLMKLRFTSPFPKDLTISKSDVTLTCSEYDGFLKVPLLKTELCYFYSNYKDYYYLPTEDIALHKSVASFVPKEHRIQATASTCYTKKDGSFLPQWDLLFEPIFKYKYDDKICYFELTDDMKRSPEVFKKYGTHLMDMLIFSK